MKDHFPDGNWGSESLSHVCWVTWLEMVEHGIVCTTVVPEPRSQPLHTLSPLWLPDHYYSTLDSFWFHMHHLLQPTPQASRYFIIHTDDTDTKASRPRDSWPHLLWQSPTRTVTSLDCPSQLPKFLTDRNLSVLSSFPPTHFYLYYLSPLHETMTWVTGVHLEQGSANRAQGPNMAQHLLL